MTTITNVPPIVDAGGNLVAASVSPIGAAAGVAPANGAVASGGSFVQSLSDAIGSISGLQTNADKAVAGLATNGGVDIHQAMLAMDQASLGMHLATTVRDKAVEAYQSLINMQM